jgi:uncharacterized protein (DUF2336 family)
MDAITLSPTKSSIDTAHSALSPEAWAESIGMLVKRYAHKGPGIGPAERAYAEKAFRQLAQIDQRDVREALAQSVKTMSDLPREVALSLARDVDSVSVPMLKFSSALTDKDLIELLDEGCPAKCAAIAQRPALSALVCHAIIDTGQQTAVARMIGNEEVSLRESHFRRLLETFKGSEAVSDALARRPDLPNDIFRNLVRRQDRELRDCLRDRRDVPVDKVSDLVLQTRERATISALRDGSTSKDVQDLVEQLHVGGRLTPPIVIRALCVGDLPFFEAAMARLAGVPLPNARILIHERGAEGLESIYMKTGMPERLFPAFRAALRLIPEIDYDGGAHDRERFVSRMIERMLTQFEDPALKMPAEDIDYLMSKLTQLVA